MKIAQTSAGEVNKTYLLIITMAAHFFNPFMGSAVNVALKKIGTDFAMSAVGLSWVTMAYLLASAIFLVPFGRLGDILGRTRLFLSGNIFFAIATVLCGLASSAAMLIAMRFVQGIAAAMMVSTSMALIISAFPPEQRGKVIGFNVSAVYVGSSLAPFIGGFLTDVLSWRSIFFINAFASSIISILIISKIKQEWSDPDKTKFDFTGSIIFILSMSMLMYGFSKLTELHGLLLLLTGLTGILIFIKYELITISPVLNIRLFTENRVFALSNLTALINYAATFAITFMLSLYLQYAKGLTAREAGLILVAQPVMMAIAASFSGRLSDRKNPRKLAALGMAISATGLLILSFIESDTTTTFILAGLVILGFGFGMFSSPNTNVAMSSVDRRVYGTASATIATMRNTGMMFSMAVASLVINFFMGTEQIRSNNLDQFVSSVKVVFAIFTVLCFLGVYASMVNNKKKPVHQSDIVNNKIV